jgi:hypothetical protein
MKKIVSHIGILRASLFAAIMYGLIGVVVIPFVIMAWLVSPPEEGRAVGIVAVFFLPLLYAVFGFLGTALLCAVYNVLSRMVGGIEITLADAEPEDIPAPAPAAAPAAAPPAYTYPES